MTVDFSKEFVKYLVQGAGVGLIDRDWAQDVFPPHLLPDPNFCEAKNVNGSGDQRRKCAHCIQCGRCFRRNREQASGS